MKLRPLLLLPTYNHASTLHEFLTEFLLKSVCDVVVVNDGSTDDTGQVLKNFLHVPAIHFPQNQGKGAALKAGFSYAKRHGYSHVITMDTDGQHLLSDLPRMLDVMSRRPDHILLGVRTFAENVPQSSKFGRSFSNFWIRVETGRRASDTQTGFRAYPLAKLPFEQCQTNRYDFEIEILTRAAWAGIAFFDVNIGVYYPPPDKRISHFRKWDDNRRLSILHAKLVTRRIFFGVSNERRGPAFMKIVLPLLGRSISYLIVPFVVCSYFLTGRTQRQAMVNFHEHLGTKGLRRYWHAYLNYVYFASVLIDRMFALHQSQLLTNFKITGDSEPMRQAKGAVLVGAHLGDWLLPAMGCFREMGRPLAIVMDNEGSPHFQKFVLEGKIPSNVQVLNASGDRLDLVFKARDVILSGGMICFLADRSLPSMRTTHFPFLGEQASWATGPFELAQLLKVPVFSFFATKPKALWNTQNDIQFSMLWDGMSLTDTETLVFRYTQQLEKTATSNRFQWYNFYHFWKTTY